MYILDELSIGLHQRDKRTPVINVDPLRDLGNTVIWWNTMKMPSKLADFLWILSRAQVYTVVRLLPVVFGGYCQ